jgi:threonine dehydratase
MTELLKLQEMRDCAQRLAAHVVHTPVVRLHSHRIQARVPELKSIDLKLELFQRTGTFKARGALSAAMALDNAALKRGITAASAGNHAIATAFAADVMKCSAKIMVQASANPVRLAATRRYGAEVIIAEDGPAAFAGAERLAREEGRTMIHPFDGPMTGVGLELIEQLPETDAVIVSIGGGGLAAGMGSAIKALKPSCRIYGVEPEGANAMQRSFACGSAVRLERVLTIADSLGPPMTLDYSYGLCKAHLEDVVTVSDSELCLALSLMFHEAKLVVEPAGAAALAALLGPLKSRLRGKRVALVVCGSNIDSEGFGRLLARGDALVRADEKGGSVDGVFSYG